VNLLDLRRQLHAAWARAKSGTGTEAALELDARRWVEAIRLRGNEEALKAAQEFDAEHRATTGQSVAECDLVSCPYGR